MPSHQSLALLTLAALLFAAPCAAKEDGMDGHDDHGDMEKGGHDDHMGHDHSGHDDHGHAEEPCACVAREQGWAIDCDDVSVIAQAAAFLQDSCPTTAKGGEDCHDAFLKLQAYHDFCMHDSLPTYTEQLLHTYEEFYVHCFIKRQYDPSLEQCPAANCDDTSAMFASMNLLNAQCSQDCSSDACVGAFQMILSNHDGCPEGEVPSLVEVALHDFEEKCEDALCNTSTEMYDLDQTVCAA